MKKWPIEHGSSTWLYLQCAHKQSLKFPMVEQKKILDLAKSLPKHVVTTIQYNDILAKLRTMCTSSEHMKWLQFWHNQQEHFVPAFRGFVLPFMNIAESGQSGMWAQQLHRKMLSLVDAVYVMIPGLRSDPTESQYIHCLQRGGRAALIRTQLLVISSTKRSWRCMGY